METARVPNRLMTAVETASTHAQAWNATFVQIKRFLLSRYRLQRGRFKVRRSKSLYMAIVIGALTTVLDEMDD
jgi:hypothetical protein